MAAIDERGPGIHDPMTTKIAFLTCLASTLFMTGLIWFVHVVHYPLFARVEAGAFARYHADHTRTTTYVVLIPMVLELVTSAYLIAGRPEGTGPGLAWLGLALVLISWAATFFLSVPSHDRLALGFDAGVHRSLVRTNAVRLASWTAHSAILLIMTARAIR